MAIHRMGILIGLAACHLLGTNAIQNRTAAPPLSDNNEVSLLQTLSELGVSNRHRHGSAPLEPNSGPLDVEFPESRQPPIGNLTQCWHTPGGGCAGGFWIEGGHLVSYGVAPAHHFPAHSGCQWTSPKRIALIHVGKCAGESLQRMLNAAPVNFTHVHQNWHEAYFDPNDYDLFVVSTRDPVSRLVSAFNWRHPDMSPVAGGATGWWGPTESQMYQCFMQYPGAANAWAEALSQNDTVCGQLARRCLHSAPARCAHLARGFSWYLSTGLTRFSASLLDAVQTSGGQKQLITVSSENFTAEAAAMFDWLCVAPEDRTEEEHVHEDYPRHNDTEISPQGLQNLEDHAVDDYFALRALNQIASAI